MALNERYINLCSDKADRDINNAINTAKKEAKEEEKIDMASKMKIKGYAIDDIADITGLSPDEIAKL
jgi:predicted transposase/invertase (TIGR01784 family)